MLYWLTYYWLAGLLLNSRPPCRSLTSTAGVKFSSWEADRRDLVPGDARFFALWTSAGHVVMRGVTFDPCGALPLNGAMSPSSGTCHALFMSVTSVFIWAQCTVVDTFSIVAIGGSPTLPDCPFVVCYCCCFDIFSTMYQQIKMRRVICEHEPHHVDAKLDCKPDLNGNVNWELMVLCLWCHLVYEKGFLTILWFNGHFYYLFQTYMIKPELKLQWYLRDVEETYIKNNLTITCPGHILSQIKWNKIINTILHK